MSQTCHLALTHWREWDSHSASLLDQSCNEIASQAVVVEGSIVESATFDIPVLLRSLDFEDSSFCVDGECYVGQFTCEEGDDFARECWREFPCALPAPGRGRPGLIAQH
ncbi:hypothetical protein KEM55_002858 [Ascosphaera atra]|nr:hypothetical protein KEM55_002858 [Ascosphaera atra]